MFVRTYAGAIVGIDAVAVTVEVNIAGGGLGMYLVGLPDNAVKESEQRIRAAFENSGERMSGRKVVVSLAPADLRKEGASFDLPIAVGILAAMGRVDAGALGGTMFAGELSLDGTLKPVRGVLPMAVRARGEGLRRLVLPADNAREAAVVEGIDVLGAGSLKEVMALLNGEAEIVPAVPGAAEPFEVAAGRYEEDFADVKGQALAKRALEIAAAGGHNVLMIGAPGSGKTMLARRMPTILPPLSPGEALETTKIHSVAGKAGVAGGLMARRPYRAPHHTISQVALIGGGQSPRPGEVSLAHNGVLFLDELPEFGRSVLEVLRQPLEEKKITVSRAKYSVEYPANFTLVAAMNPCPCGYYNHPARECVCSPGSVHRYMSRISGPLMDRIDMHVEVTPVSAAELSAAAPGESSAAIRARVVRAREVQAARFRCAQGVHTNAMMNAAMLREYCRPDAASAALLERAMERLNLSARAYDRILKVARTIADLAGRDTVAAADVAGRSITGRWIGVTGGGDEKMAEDNGMGGGRRGGAGYRGGIRRRVCRAAGDRRPGIRLARGGARQPGGVAARDFADGAFGTSECVFLQPGRCGRGTVSCRQSGVLGHQRRQRPQGLQRAAGHEGGARRAGRAGGGDIPRLCRVPDVRFGRPHGKDIRAGELHGNLAGVP